ncbi:MAG: hypothetical protein R3308_10615, partial [Thiohalobacterales bacterium]|nr:hypothetical protein [Thiohalobacterales bacterium]
MAALRDRPSRRAGEASPQSGRARPRTCTRHENRVLARQLEERLAHGPLVQSRTRSRELPRSILLVGAGYFGLKHLLNILLMQSHFGARDYRVTVVSADDTSLQRAFLSGDTHATRRIVQLAAAGDQVGRALNAFTHAEREVLRRAWRESRIRFIDAQSDGSIVQLMRGGDSDCVFIATPAETHYRYALEAMRAGA